MVGGGGRATDASLPDVRASSATQMTDSSLQSSVDSHTGLLKHVPVSASAGANGRATSQTAAASFGRSRDGTVLSHNHQHSFFNADDGDDGQSHRTLDMDQSTTAGDDDDDDDNNDNHDDIDNDLYHQVAHPRRARPAVKEESLAEFLAAYDPPGTTVSPASPSAVSPKPSRKASAAALMGRLTRTRSSSHAKDAVMARNPLSLITDSRSLSSRSAVSRHIPLQVGPSPMPVQMPPQTPLSPSLRAAPRRLQAREADSPLINRTADLADFLRDSEPPMGESLVVATPDSHGGFARMFGRRKKSIAW